MFAFYTCICVGILWLEFSASALFLGEYGANSLPWVYIASAGMGTVLGFVYSRLQKTLLLRHVIVVIPVLMAVPLFLFRIGLNPIFLGGYAIFLMRLWLEAIYILNELNTSITANQLFNIREIKRAYPLISSGILLADVLSGFSMPVLRQLVGLENVILVACIMLLIGGGILYYIGQTYQQSFPDLPRRTLHEKQTDFTTRRLQGPLYRYVVLVITFFVMAQVLSLLLDFQYLRQLEQNLNLNAGNIADFIGLFSGTLGIFELLTQWFVSSRMIERMGVFKIALLPPLLILGLGFLSLIGLVGLFVGVITLKFVDELLRYTLVAGMAPVLFQAIPDRLRSRIESDVRGFAEPLSTGLTGAGILLTIWFFHWVLPSANELFVQGTLNRIFLAQITLFAGIWLVAVFLLRSRYVGLLVLSAERGQLSLHEVDLHAFKRSVIDALERPSSEADKQSCIELLEHIDPKHIGDVVAPRLASLSPRLQFKSLEAMLNYPNAASLEYVQSLLRQPLSPDTFALALRYIWRTHPSPNVQDLLPHLEADVDSAIRGTAAALLLRHGNSLQKAEATDLLRRMLTNKYERERVMACRALGDATYLQALRLYIEPLLQDDSLRVRCALLEAIAATHLEEYYPCLIRGLYYKSTRDAAMRSLIRLDSDAIPWLVEAAEDPYKPDIVRTCAWSVIGQIGTPDAVDVLVNHLNSSWGTARRSLLRTLLKLPQEKGVDAVADVLGRRGVEALIHQEMMLLGQIYGSLVDLSPQYIDEQEAELLRRALNNLERDVIERLFLLMRFLYPSSSIQAAAFNLQSESANSVARALEILDNAIDLPCKKALLSILDRRPNDEKLQNLSDIVDYEPMSPSQRLRYLLDLRHFLSDWVLACCFHLARRAHWSLTTEHILAGLHHPVGFVREAVLHYLQMASPRALHNLLPIMEHDSDRLVSAQVQKMMAELGLEPTDDKDRSNGFRGSTQSLTDSPELRFG
ncbi:MAG: Npt1/Npt2 family nucleotide transporter [Elainellaceae cyanobacterium]